MKAPGKKDDHKHKQAHHSNNAKVPHDYFHASFCTSFVLFSSACGMGNISCLPGTKPLKASVVAALPQRTRSGQRRPSPASSSLLSFSMLVWVTAVAARPTLALTAF